MSDGELAELVMDYQGRADTRATATVISDGELAEKVMNYRGERGEREETAELMANCPIPPDFRGLNESGITWKWPL